MTDLVAPAATAALARQTVCAALRRHILEITSLLIRSGFSPELQAADMRLTGAISGYQFGREGASIETLRARLQAYCRAAMSGGFSHALIEPLVDDAARAAVRSPAGSVRASPLGAGIAA